MDKENIIQHDIRNTHKWNIILAIKKDGKWMEQGIIMLNEVSQTKKDKYHMFFPIYGIYT
jgi:hypothetical protein